MPIVIPPLRVAYNPTWEIQEPDSERIEYPDYIERTSSRVYIREIFPPLRGYYFSNFIKEHIRYQASHPNELVFIPPTAVVNPFRISEAQFNGILQVQDDAFLAFTYDLLNLIHQHNQLDASDWTTTRFLHQIFRHAAAICRYRFEIASDLNNIVYEQAIDSAHILKYSLYLRHVTTEHRVYDRLQQIFVEAAIHIRNVWSLLYEGEFPDDVTHVGPETIPGYVQPVFNEDLRGDVEDAEEDPNLPDPFIWDQRYAGYLRGVYHAYRRRLHQIQQRPDQPREE